MNREQKTYRLAYWIASFIIGAPFLSGYYKMLQPADFALAVYRFHLLPGFLVNAVSLYIPWLELGCGVCLLFIPKYRVAALWISLGLLVLFPAGIAINLIRGSAFGCGCFSHSPAARPMDGLGVARNIELMLLALLALHARRKSAA